MNCEKKLVGVLEVIFDTSRQLVSRLSGMLLKSITAQEGAGQIHTPTTDLAIPFYDIYFSYIVISQSTFLEHPTTKPNPQASDITS